MAYPRRARHRVARWWRRAEWPLLACVLLASLALTYAGLPGPSARTLDLERLHETLWSLGPGRQNFVGRPGIKGTRLEVAQWLFLFVAIYAVVKAWAVLFREQVRLLRLRLMSGHAVVCGLGERGKLLALGLRDRGIPVVAIEASSGAPGVDRCEEHGIVVLRGDAADGLVLREAGIVRADYVIAITGDDAVNLQIAARARAAAGGRFIRTLTCYVHVADVSLLALVRERELSADREPGFRLQAFSVYETAAVALLLDHPITPDPGTTPHLIVIGLGRLGSSLVVHAARRWHTQHDNGGPPLRITVIDRNVDDKVARLHERIPALASVCEFVSIELPATAQAFRDATFLVHAGRPANHLYVCLGNETEALAAALALRPALQRVGVPCAVRVSRDAGLDGLLALPFDVARREPLHIFGMLSRTCRVEVVLRGTNEVIARACHEQYVRAERDNAHTADVNPSMLAWERLPEALRESNRRLADDIARKVDALGYEIVPLIDWLAPIPTFTPAEIEVMARMEHARWMLDRRKAGWRLGDKNVARRTTPHLVEWEELGEEDKNKDRAAVEDIPRLLLLCGLTLAGKPYGRGDSR